MILPSSPRIFVADDDPDIRKILGRRLPVAGYQVETSSNGQNALDMIKGNPPNLAIVDWMMPVMSGIELCQQLRQSSEFDDLPVIMLTSRGFETDLLQGFRSGVDDYMVKPFTFGELLARIEAVLAPDGAQ